MAKKKEFELIKASFVYKGVKYAADIVCSNVEAGCYWFVFDKKNEENLLGTDIEFRTVEGKLQSIEDFADHQEFINCIINVIEVHLNELCV